MPTPSTLASDGDQPNQTTIHAAPESGVRHTASPNTGVQIEVTDPQAEPRKHWKEALDACSEMLKAVRDLKRTLGELKETLDSIEERNDQ